MCGEHSGPKPAPKGMPGSSPHVRGAHSLYLRQLFADGIIPACAGSTSTIRDVCYRHGDHPRMCGEHDIRRSLPRTACGIIPACAGSTPTRPRITNSARDHPRMCGEHSFLSILKMFSMGSSPHVRGAQRGCYQGLRAGGIIPACAGSTHRSREYYYAPRDHPRMCGEHDGAQAILTTDKGSSPHVRGAHPSIVASIAVTGIIPACAGSTMDSTMSMWTNGDHPRMCGEHVMIGIPLVMRLGSSPHVRGAPKV